MKVSLVIPCFNHAEFIRPCLDSVLRQRNLRCELEVIVIDGSSTDGSAQVISEYGDRLAYWVSEPDDGQTDALVKGFALSTGQIMGWLNSDDLLADGAVLSVVEFFQARADIDVVYGDARRIDRSGQVIGSRSEMEFDRQILLWGYDYLPQPATFWRREIWDKSGGLDPAMDCAMDYDLWMKFLKAGGRFNHLPRELAAVRLYPEQKNQRLRSRSNLEDRIIQERFLDRPVSDWERNVKWAWHRARRVVKRALAA